MLDKYWCFDDRFLGHVTVHTALEKLRGAEPSPLRDQVGKLTNWIAGRALGTARFRDVHAPPTDDIRFLDDLCWCGPKLLPRLIRAFLASAPPIPAASASSSSSSSSTTTAALGEDAKIIHKTINTLCELYMYPIRLQMDDARGTGTSISAASSAQADDTDSEDDDDGEKKWFPSAPVNLNPGKRGRDAGSYACRWPGCDKIMARADKILKHENGPQLHKDQKKKRRAEMRSKPASTTASSVTSSSVLAVMAASGILPSKAVAASVAAAAAGATAAAAKAATPHDSKTVSGEAKDTAAAKARDAAAAAAAVGAAQAAATLSPASRAVDLLRVVVSDATHKARVGALLGAFPTAPEAATWTMGKTASFGIPETALKSLAGRVQTHLKAMLGAQETRTQILEKLLPKMRTVPADWALGEWLCWMEAATASLSTFGLTDTRPPLLDVQRSTSSRGVAFKRITTTTDGSRLATGVFSRKTALAREYQFEDVDGKWYQRPGRNFLDVKNWWSDPEDASRQVDDVRRSLDRLFAMHMDQHALHLIAGSRPRPSPSVRGILKTATVDPPPTLDALVAPSRKRHADACDERQHHASPKRHRPEPQTPHPGRVVRVDDTTDGDDPFAGDGPPSSTAPRLVTASLALGAVPPTEPIAAAATSAGAVSLSAPPTATMHMPPSMIAPPAAMPPPAQQYYVPATHMPPPPAHYHQLPPGYGQPPFNPQYPAGGYYIAAPPQSMAMHHSAHQVHAGVLPVGPDIASVVVAAAAKAQAVNHPGRRLAPSPENRGSFDPLAQPNQAAASAGRGAPRKS